MVQREERCAAVEADAVERMERLVKAEADLQEREEAVKRREAAVASAAADAAMAGADLDAREAKLRERERQLCTAPPVKVEPNEWADAVAASAEHHLRELSLENKQLKRHQRRTAKRGRRIAAVLLWRKMHVLDARTGAQKAFAAWYVFSQNTQPSTKQKRVRAGTLGLRKRAGAVLDGVHAHYSASKLVKGGLRRELSLERFWALARDFHLAPAFASYAYLDASGSRCVARGRRTISGAVRAGPGPTRLGGGGQGGRAAVCRRGARAGLHGDVERARQGRALARGQVPALATSFARLSRFLCPRFGVLRLQIMVGRVNPDGVCNQYELTSSLSSSLSLCPRPSLY